MDGNGRWAKPVRCRASGASGGGGIRPRYRRGMRSAGRALFDALCVLDRNWKRPTDEVSVLMRLLLKYLREEVEELNENNVRLEAIGQFNSLHKRVQKQLFSSIEALRKNTGLVLNLALSYSGRSDLARAVQMLAMDIRRGKLSPEDVDEAVIRNVLSTAAMPDPDLLIRTSGEKRISNFLLWETAYSEIVFVDDTGRVPASASVRRHRRLPDARTPVRQNQRANERPPPILCPADVECACGLRRWRLRWRGASRHRPNSRKTGCVPNRGNRTRRHAVHEQDLHHLHRGAVHRRIHDDTR